MRKLITGLLLLNVLIPHPVQAVRIDFADIGKSAVNLFPEDSTGSQNRWKEGFGGDIPEFEIIQFIKGTTVLLMRFSDASLKQIYKTDPAFLRIKIFQNLDVEFSVHSLFLEGIEKAAISYPSGRRIVFSKSKWVQLTNTEKQRLIFHELLLLAGVSDFDYSYSQKTEFLLRYYPRLLDPTKAANLVSEKIKLCDVTFFEDMEQWSFDWSDPHLTTLPLNYRELNPTCIPALKHLSRAARKDASIFHFDALENPLAFAVVKRARTLTVLKDEISPLYYLDDVRELLRFTSPLEKASAHSENAKINTSPIEQVIFYFDEPVIRLFIESLSDNELRNFRTFQTGQDLISYSVDQGNWYAVQLIKNRLQN